MPNVHNKDQKIDSLVECVVSAMDMDALQNYVRNDLREYYKDIEDVDKKHLTKEFNELYSDIMGGV